jgi:glutaredoxin 3
MRLLDSKGVTYEVCDLDDEPAREGEMVTLSGGRFTVPQIFINGRHVGGSDELAELERLGKLDALLVVEPS